MEKLNDWASHGGRQQVWKHASSATGTDMVFSIFLPAGDGPFPLITYLSGLTCTHANVTEKGEFRRAAAAHGVAILCPDTSPRGEGVADDEAYDLGQGAGFYLDATEAPWAPHFRMQTYIEQELPALVAAHFPLDMARQGIFGHSMGGHGALTVALRNPGRFRAISAFSPIVAPTQAPWGEKAFTAYLGPDRTRWDAYDAVAMIEAGARLPDLLIDVGDSDPFLDAQLKPELLEKACATARIPLLLRYQPGYDHSYYFISSFMEQHLGWHAQRLR